ncbi:glycosyltransferase family 2 protein [Candidatus Cryosericum odellii]|jgi:abequosyltransferase|uniref:Glycosyltransferase n=1 Tax=Candidatus Cryosericum odellii TaxID=2290917 RepID=A0A398CWM1_9BACT|nr:glycosyltransferase family 2 protein [Candidatus Cryosericum odellii]RIE07065.1 glycosyltransferase [Candidatus Cryosericum odellii]
MPEKDNIKNRNIKLSVAIPTYNGARYIREALDSIVSQLTGISEEVEIVVSDNASTDETLEIIEEYQTKYSFIKYFRNAENLGPDRNYDLAVRRAKGQFVWLLSDDDKIRDAGINKVIDVINKHPNIAAIFMNYESVTPLNCSQDCLCLNGNEFFYKTSFKNGLVSSNVIKKSIWENIETSKYFYSNWIHFGVLIEALSTRPCFIVSYPFLLQIGAKETRWGENGSFFYVGLRLVKIFKNMSKYGYKKNIIKRGIFVIERGYPKYIPLAKAAGLKVDANLIKEVVGLYKSFPSFWIMDLPLLLTPSMFYKIAYRVYKMGLFKKMRKKLRGQMS